MRSRFGRTVFVKFEITGRGGIAGRVGCDDFTGEDALCSPLTAASRVDAEEVATWLPPLFVHAAALSTVDGNNRGQLLTDCSVGDFVLALRNSDCIISSKVCRTFAEPGGVCGRLFRELWTGELDALCTDDCFVLASRDVEGTDANSNVVEV
jgi:hypothetical protein